MIEQDGDRRAGCGGTVHQVRDRCHRHARIAEIRDHRRLGLPVLLLAPPALFVAAAALGDVKGVRRELGHELLGRLAFGPLGHGMYLRLI